MFIVESGIVAKDELVDGQVHDYYRIKYFADYFERVNLAIKAGVDMMDYTSWDCIHMISESTSQMVNVMVLSM